jgi:predicted small metal-binding protein
MPSVSCEAAGAAPCGAKLSASSKDELMRQVADHLQKKHKVKTVTQTLMNYMSSLAK